MKKPIAPALEPGLSAALRRFLYLTAAINGAAVLIVEILGAKMLAPYVGTSHFVWTAQISVTLLSLACGYYFGGWLVDRSARLSRLYFCVLGAALYLGLTVPLCAPVAYWCLDFRLAVGSALASLFLFFVPLTLLAATGPFLIRVLTLSVNAVGGQAGRLSAVSTFGSVFGAVLIGYVVVPHVANSVTMFLTAALLLLVALIYLGVWGRSKISIAAAMTVVGLGVAGYGVWQESHLDYGNWKQIARRNSNFGLLQVLDNDGVVSQRRYLNDNLLQNTYDTNRHQSLSMFTYMLHDLAQAYTTNVSDILCIGMGVGVVPMQFAREGARVDVVEINPAIVPLATRYFDLQPDKLTITIGDGRHFLNRGRKQYDAIILDAFLGDSSPSHLMTREAFAAMRARLKPGGVLVINTFGNLKAKQDFFTASLEKTLGTVFRSVKIHSDGYELTNLFFVASDQPELNLGKLPDWEAMPAHVRSRAKAAFDRSPLTIPEHGRVLTDDFNPVEFYDAANRENLRKELAIAMRPR